MEKDPFGSWFQNSQSVAWSHASGHRIVEGSCLFIVLMANIKEKKVEEGGGGGGEETVWEGVRIVKSEPKGPLSGLLPPTS